MCATPKVAICIRVTQITCRGIICIYFSRTIVLLNLFGDIKVLV